MRENLLKKQPTWGLRRAQGTGQKSATPATLAKVILVLLTMFLLPSAAWGITKQYYLYGMDKNKVIGTTSDESSISHWAISGSYESFDASDAGFTSIRTTSLTLTSEEKFYKIKSVTVDIGAGDWGTGQETSSIEIRVNNESPSNTSYNVDHQYTGSASSISTDFKVVTFNPENTEEPITIEVRVSGTVDVRIQSIKVEFTENYGLTIGETALTSDNVDSEGNITDITDVKFTSASGDTPAKLTLTDASISSDIISSLEALTINLEGTNTLSGSISYLGSATNKTLAFTGSGSLGISMGSLYGAIYNFTDVDFGDFNLATPIAGTCYVINPDHAGLVGALGTMQFSGSFTPTNNITITKDNVYPLWIATVPNSFTQVTQNNRSSILGDDKITFDGNNNTLTLKDASLTGNIISGLSGGLNIVVDGENQIVFSDDSTTCIRNYAPNATLSFQKSNDSESCSLLLKGPNFIKNFSSISYENGIYLSGAQKGSDDLNPAFIYYTYLDGFKCTLANSYISSLTFSTTKPSESIWIGETQVGEDGRFTGIENVSFDKESKTLTLNGATISNNIISSLPNLTINLAGENRLDYTYSQDYIYYYIISSNPSATLTFTTDGDGSLSSDISNYGFPWKGFAGNPTFKNKLVFTHDAASERIKVLSAPEMSYSSSISGSKLTLSGLCLGNEQFSYYYAITYADNEGNISKTKKTLTRVEPNPATGSDDITITHTPFTVEASVVYEDQFGNTTESETTIGKYFSFAESMILTTLASETEEKEIVLPALLPATEENDGITFELSSGNENIIYKNDDSKWMIKGYGNTFISAVIKTDDTTPFTVLNEGTSLVVNVLHNPTFTAYYGEDNTKVYDGNGSGNVSVEISSSDDDDLGSEYSLMYYLGTDNTTPTPYEEVISLNSTTTVNAFIRYVNSDNSSITYDSEPVSMEYLVSQKLETPAFEGNINFQTCYLKDYSLAKPAGLKVYIITEISLTDNTLKAVSIDYIPKYVPVLLEKEGETPEGGYVAATYTGEEEEFSNNKLYYTDYQIDDLTGTEYVLFNNEFVKATGIIAAGHCYLSLDAPHANTRGFSIDTSGNGTTGIKNASLNDNREVMTKQWYDLQGRKIQKPTKAGLYIVNGKKVVIK